MILKRHNRTGSMESRRANRVIHVPRRFVANEWGGTETVILEISRQQKQMGWAPEIYTSMALAHSSNEFIGGLPVRRYEYCYPFLGLSSAERLSMDKKGGNLLSASLFSGLLAAKDVRLFHAHALKRLGGEVRTVARLRGKPFVVSLHGGVFDVPAAELEGMLAPIKDKWEWGKPLGALLGSRRVLEDADQVICVGQSEMDEARKHLSHERIVYLPNGVDTTRFRDGDGARFRALHGIPPDAYVILSMGRIDPQKNQFALIEAFAGIRSDLRNARLLLIGPETSAEYAARLRNAISELNLHEFVHLLPGIRNDDPSLVDAYHACDLFAITSRHEPFGIVVLEAWSAGRPVVAAHVGGLKRLTRHESTALVFDPNALDARVALESAMRRCANEPDLARHIAETGQREAREHYDWASVAAQLENIYAAAEDHAGRGTGKVKA